MPPIEKLVAHQFDDADQQRHASSLGMWLFLATEVLFFGGLFLAYTVYRYSYPEAFHAASSHTLLWVGTLNTAILLASSFTMVLAVHAAEHAHRRTLFWLLIATAALGTGFLLFKAYEYAHEISEGLFPGPQFRIEGAAPAQARMFFYLYFVMTGLHALHVTIGIVLLIYFAVRSLFVSLTRSTFSTAIDLLGLYWHFVDIVWVFLFPLIYLIGRHA